MQHPLPAWTVGAPQRPIRRLDARLDLSRAERPSLNGIVLLRRVVVGKTVRIAQIAPLAESAPPKLYGGTERVVSWLTEELVSLGHDVTLFATGDSVTSAQLVPVAPRALRLSAHPRTLLSQQLPYSKQ